MISHLRFAGIDYDEKLARYLVALIESYIEMGESPEPKQLSTKLRFASARHRLTRWFIRNNPGTICVEMKFFDSPEGKRYLDSTYRIRFDPDQLSILVIGNSRRYVDALVPLD